MADSPSSGNAAAELKLKHAQNSHNPTVEDVPDEDMPQRAQEGAAANDAKPSWGEPPSVKSIGKQKAREPDANAAKLDTQSHELFPELGGPKPKASTGVAPIWSAKSSHVNGKTNGAAPVNGTTPHTSAPASGVSTPTSSGLHGPPSISIPGRNVETLYLEPQHVLPRNQLKRPLPDIIKDLNRKSRANLNLSTLPGGKLKFDATGPQDIAQQALRDLVQQIGTKVRTWLPTESLELKNKNKVKSLADSPRTAICESHNSLLHEGTHYRKGRSHY